MNLREVLDTAAAHLTSLRGHTFEVISIARPRSAGAAADLVKIISKLSPLLGNLIELEAVEYLNRQTEYRSSGVWKRQDPGFPDAIFVGGLNPPPGFEIKAWFPLATEITARFRDSQNNFATDQTDVCLLAWLPQHLFFGKPLILDACVLSGREIAEARDNHYHNPPDYLVLEPEDTKQRTRNLQQTNTNGYKFQGTTEQLSQARKLVSRWGPNGRKYKPSLEYQVALRQLLAKFPYRLDTNFAKMDRIVHEGVERFKDRVTATKFHSRTMAEWSRLLYGTSEDAIRDALRSEFGIGRLA